MFDHIADDVLKVNVNVTLILFAKLAVADRCTVFHNYMARPEAWEMRLKYPGGIVK